MGRAVDKFFHDFPELVAQGVFLSLFYQRMKGGLRNAQERRKCFHRSPTVYELFIDTEVQFIFHPYPGIKGRTIDTLKSEKDSNNYIPALIEDTFNNLGYERKDGTKPVIAAKRKNRIRLASGRKPSPRNQLQKGERG